jgi:hypothetical protein
LLTGWRSSALTEIRTERRRRRRWWKHKLNIEQVQWDWERRKIGLRRVHDPQCADQECRRRQCEGCSQSSVSNCYLFDPPLKIIWNPSHHAKQYVNRRTDPAARGQVVLEFPQIRLDLRAPDLA